MSLILANSYPENTTIKTYGLKSLPYVSLRNSLSNLEILPQDFCKMVTLYLFGGEGIEFSSDDEVFYADVVEPAGSLVIFDTEKQLLASIEEQDWHCVVHYFFTNTDIEADDCRIDLICEYAEKDKFLTGMKQKLLQWLLYLQVVDGYNEANYRFQQYVV